MSVPDFQSFMRPVLAESARGPIATTAIISAVVEALQLTPADLEETVASGGKTRVYDRVQWAATYLAQAGLVERPRRGIICISESGRAVLTNGPQRITRAWLIENFPKFRNFAQPASGMNSEEPDAGNSVGLTPEETLRVAHRQIEVALATELLERLVSSSPEFFEHTIRELLVKMGYGASSSDSQVVGGSGDDGVDGVVNLDALGVDQVYFQAKRYQLDASIGSGALRDFFGALALKDVTKGIFVTTARFSEAARSTAEKLNKRIVLIDGRELAALLIKYSVGCRVRVTFAISEIEEEYFE